MEVSRNNRYFPDKQVRPGQRSDTRENARKRRVRVRNIRVTYLSARMNTRICSPRPDNANGRSQYGRQSSVELALNGSQPRLNLPAREFSAFVLHVEAQASTHGA